MELHDEDPDHFEAALKFIYTLRYEPWPATSTNEDKPTSMRRDMGIHRTADKYNIERLLQPAMNNFQTTLDATKRVESLQDVITTHYSTVPRPSHAFGISIVSHLFRRHRHFVRQEGFVDLCTSLLVLAADVVAILARCESDNCPAKDSVSRSILC
jgi:hypothetical protein